MKKLFSIHRIVAATATALLFLNAIAAHATIYTWTNTAGGSWSAGANWSPNGVPGSGDTALITTSGTYAVGLSAPVTVNSLTVGTSNGSGTQSFSTSILNLTVQGSLVVNNTGAFTLSGGTLTVNGTIQGLLKWTGGQFGNGPGPLTLATNATLVLAGSTGTDYNVGQFVTNTGTIEVQSGNLVLNYCTYYGGLQNLPGGLINLEGNVSIDGCGGVGLINGGTFKSAGTVSAINQTFQNTGTVNVETGSLLLYGPSSDANGTYNGPGTTVITNGSFTENGTLTTSNLMLAGGTLTVNGTIQGLLKWTGGQFGSGSGPLTLATNATLVLAGSNGTDYSMGQFVTNAGTIEVQSGNLALNYCTYYGGLLNLPGAIINLKGNVSIDGCGGVGLINEGTLVKSAGSGVSAINQTFQNTSTVTVETGSLLLYGPSSDANGTYNGPGTTVITNGSFTENGTLTVSNLVLAGGSLSGNGTIHGLITWTGGLIGPGNNFLTIAPDATLLLEGLNGTNYTIGQAVTNAGVIRVLSGNLSINYCGYYGQLINLGGALVDLAGDVSISGDGCSPGLSNFGTVRKSSGTGTSAIVTAFQNQPNGTLNVQSGTILLNAPVTDNGGSYTGAGTTLVTNTTLTVNAALVSSNIVLAGGSLSGNGTIHGLITWTGGLIGPGNNFLTIAPDATLLLEGLNGTNYTIGQAVTNAGVIRVLSGNLSINYCGYYGQLINLGGALVDLAGDVSISGDGCSPGLSNFGTVRKSSGTGTSAIVTAFQNQANGTLDIKTGIVSLLGTYNLTSGTLSFTLNSLTNFGRLNLASSVTLGGPLNVNLAGNFVPSNGDQFHVVSSSGLSGTFSSVSVPAGISVIYGTNGVFLDVTGLIPVQIINTHLAGSNLLFQFLTASGQSYTIQRNDDLATNNWAFYTNITGNGTLFQFQTPVMATPAQNFFRVRVP